MTSDKNHGNAKPPAQHKLAGTGGTTTNTTEPSANTGGNKKKAAQFTVELAGDEYDNAVAPSLQQKVKVVSQLRAIENVYDRRHQLGLGAFAKVFYGEHRVSGAPYAIKKIDRSKMLWGDRDALEDEINNLIAVRDGPNIVQLYEVYEEKAHCYLVMELMRGGELFDVIVDRKIFSETEARAITRCLLSGLEYMHASRIAHRDLKPENLLLADPNDTNSIKVADFGFAKRVITDNGCRTLCGTPGYLAPEILERWPAYDTKCDLWGVGVILFLLLGGYLPFEDEEEDKVFEKTRNGQYFFHPSYWKTVSKQAKNFVTKVLTINPKKRYSASEALKDEWMEGSQVMPDNKEDLAAKEDLLAGKNKLKAAIMAVKATNRLQVLNDNFAGYLERKREDSTTMRVTGGENAKAKEKTKKFIEDSQSGKPIREFYDFGDVLGEGGYACVYRAVHTRTKEVYAIKDIDTSVLEQNSKSALRDEIAALKLLRGGPYIIRLFDVFEAEKNTYVVMEECKGGDLLDRVTEKEFYTEREARKTCNILFQAMDYIHKKKIAHRDIKPENVLLVNRDDDTTIKIADFGFAKRVIKPNCLRTLCGTAQYVAPEVLDLHSPGYDQRADMWSVGVVTYILLGGYAPFDGPVHELANVICKGEYEFHEKYWGDISDAAKTMIRNLLQVDPEKRYSAELALQCPWMIVEEESLAVKDLSSAQEELKKKKLNEDNLDTIAPTKINPLNKYESLDCSFTAGIGTLEEIIARKRMQSTSDPLDTLGEDSEFEEESVVEDSSSGKQFEMLYQWGRVIEQGDFSVTREARHVKSKDFYAVKAIKRTDLETSDAVAVQDEISTLQMLNDCPQIITLHDVFEEPDFTYMVMERLRGGELIDQIIARSHYSENDARQVARNILTGLEFCHNRRIANRNIKTENLILTEKNNLVDVKISDFGFAKRVLYPNALRTQIGTEGYVAPEILEHRPAYDVQCDMWSLGVVLYILLGGYRPFRGEGEEVMRLTRYGEFKFHKRYWRNISEGAKILISRMLTVDPICRITATAALHSDWIQMTNEELDVRDLNSNMEEMKTMRESARAKMKAAVFTVVATGKLIDLGEHGQHFHDND
jgi:serine/threonine protein kinase